MLHEVLTAPKAQDVHISCPVDLVEPFVAELQQQLADTPTAEIYDYGVSSRFGLGYVIVAWKGRVPAAFEAQLDSDDRLEGHSLSCPTEEPLYIAARKGV